MSFGGGRWVHDTGFGIEHTWVKLREDEQQQVVEANPVQTKMMVNIKVGELQACSITSSAHLRAGV